MAPRLGRLSSPRVLDLFSMTAPRVASISDRPSRSVVEVVGNRILVYVPGTGSPWLIHSALLSDSKGIDRNSVFEQLRGTSWGRRLFPSYSPLSPQPDQSPEDWDKPDCVGGIELFITDRCNLGCRYCLAHGKDKTSRELQPAEILQVCEPYLRTPQRTSITLSGGEPLLRSGAVRELIHRFRHTGRYRVGQIRLLTNLLLMDRDTADFLAKHEVIVCVSIHSEEIGNGPWWENGTFTGALNILREAGCSDGGLIFVVDSKHELEWVCQMPLDKLRRYTGWMLVSPDLTRWPHDLVPEVAAQQLSQLRRKATENGLRLTGWWDKPTQMILEGKTNCFAWCPGLSGGAVAIWPDGRLSRCRYLRPSQFADDGRLKRRLAEMENTGLQMPWNLVGSESLRRQAMKGCDDCWLQSICAGCCSLTWPERAAGNDRRCRFLREVTRLLLVERARSAIVGREIREAIALLRPELL